ncbi:MAG: membrane-bound O-acyltransferase family protein [Draconibacterium sp.]|nr:MAG: membrane-bound O-acyltransferase family protein [Draconibacterium sp.]
MLFNSIEFILFFLLVFVLYWTIPPGSVKKRNLFLLLTSYIFYAWWDIRFLGLIILSSAVDYSCGIAIAESEKQHRRKSYLLLSIFVNLGILGFFKYSGFFIEELQVALHHLGIAIHTRTLNVILPVGISFYTFQTMSYSIDVYRGKVEPTRDMLAFFAFVSFFPQLVAGPIERAGRLLPQFGRLKYFDYNMAVDGFRRVLWGLFAKIAVADTVAPVVDQIFIHYNNVGSGVLALGAFLFAVQIYGDFAGYSNIAIGTAALLGFRLMENFRTPYFAANLSEFWSRWHISLSTWFRDYVYIPLGGNRCNKFKYSINILITFVISGLWHGANWTFIVWGLLHGIFYLVSKLVWRNTKTRKSKTFNFFPVLVTFTIVSLLFVIFRSEHIWQAFVYLRNMLLFKEGAVNLLNLVTKSNMVLALFFVVILIIVEGLQRNKRFALDFSEKPVFFRLATYYFLVFSILLTFSNDRVFIYFQF